MKKKIRVSYKVTVAGRYVFKTRFSSFTFNTMRELKDIVKSEVSTVIQFKLRNKGLSISNLEILSITEIK